MTHTAFGPHAIAALRIARWAAWLAVAFLLGLLGTSRAGTEPELLPTQSTAQHVAASQCGCSATPGTIS